MKRRKSSKSKPKLKIKTRCLWLFRCRTRSNGLRRCPPYKIDPAFWMKVFNGEIGTYYSVRFIDGV